jgi:RNA polymerase sigma-70 factor (ECF subfamily)
MTTRGGLPFGAELGSSSADRKPAPSAAPYRLRTNSGVTNGTLSSNPIADAAMDRFADGDNGAFDELYRAIAPRLYAYALRIAKHDRWLAEDLVQHTFANICERRGGFIRGARTMPWALSILRHRHLDMLKKPKREEFFPEGVGDTSEDCEAPGPAECTERKQLDELFRQELRRLPASQREVCELFYYGGLTQAEVAEMLDVSVAAVKSRVQRATESLRQIFERATEGSLR